MRHPDSPGSSSPSSPDDAAVSRVAAALRAEALRHAPDSAAMLARVEDAAKAGPRRPAPHGGLHRDRLHRDRPVPWLRPARAAAAACAVLAVAGGGWLIVGHLRPHPTHVSPAAESSTRYVAGTATASPDGGGAAEGRSATSASRTMTPSASPPASLGATPGASPQATVILGSPGHTRVQQGFLWSDGSIDSHSTTSWSQSDITLKSGQAVTSMNVVLRLPDTPGLASTGAWSTVPAADITIGVTQGSGVLVYTFTLRAGVTLAPGTYEFAGAYSHAPGGRNADYDTYQATASAGQASVDVYGNFFPTS